MSDPSDQGVRKEDGGRGVKDDTTEKRVVGKTSKSGDPEFTEGEGVGRKETEKRKVSGRVPVRGRLWVGREGPSH